MTDASRTADSSVVRFFSPIAQNVIGVAILSVLGYGATMLNSISAQLSTYSTNQAVLIQRVDSLERRVDASEKLTDSVRSTAQESKYQISSIMESIKNGVLSGRPK